MSFKIVGNMLPKFFLDELEKSIAADVAKALRQDFPTVKTAAKALAAEVEISMETIKKWYNGSNPPKAVHLIIMARASPSVRHALLKLIERERSAE